ncbi:ADP-ribose pyrophosphatase [mine drainage metagenome]|uniref:ADP-ribose pyrophosphatase n=1 Tax=mine drainage metagenome TaxID=410659 RepID=A0A1J5S6E2_9ZZZZ
MPFTADDVDILDRSTPFQGYFRIDRYHLRHRTHSGGWTAPMHREIFERGHAVGILLYDPRQDRVGLIEQFRPGALAAGWHPWLIEVVAGIIDEGETPRAVALRECREEAGITVGRLEPICRYLVSPGGSTESMELFCAEVNADQLGGLHGLAEEGEDIRVLTLPRSEAMTWLREGRIANSMTIIALQWLALSHDSLVDKWK